MGEREVLPIVCSQCDCLMGRGVGMKKNHLNIKCFFFIFQFAPFKPGNKGTLAERAKALGLEPLSLTFVKGEGQRIEAQKYINKNEKGLICFLTHIRHTHLFICLYLMSTKSCIY